MVSVSPFSPEFDDVRVIFLWQGPRATWQELKVLQRTLPGFINLGLTEIRERVGDSDRWQFDVMPRWQAEAEIVRPAEAAGLRVELIKVRAR
ncbi:unnamed protein product [Gemmata massiliana]|uniref:Uncharacterized protein n=1 Tax=Gemmata massiliana TaxID=1210884 RepID=A0A6P2CUW0_9BACT|nr:hypothetical protein [Gemmata massiliana]VTR92703.1 unnamed protein product [Gemmata massiliana]